MRKYIMATLLALSSIACIEGMVSQQDYFATLPLDMQRLLSTFIATGPDISTAVKNIINFARTNKSLASLLKDRRFIQNLINHLATQYPQESAEESKIAAAAALSPNPEAQNWMKESIGSSPSMLNAAQASLLKAAQTGDLKTITFLVNTGVNPNSTGAKGYTPLIEAASQGHKSIVDFLLAHGAGVNSTNDSGDTALKVAAIAGHKDIVEDLMKSGTDINIKNAQGFPILLTLASRPRLIDIFNIIVQDKDVDVNYANPQAGNMTALILASSLGNTQAVKALIDKGANVNARAQGGTALSYARRNGHTDIAKVLESHGAR